MEISELLSWMQFGDLATRTEEELRESLEDVLDSYPEDRSVSQGEERLLSRLEDLLEQDSLNFKRLRDLFERSEGLSRADVSPLTELQRRLEAVAMALSEEEWMTERLQRFSDLLLQAEDGGHEQALVSIAAIEVEMQSTWDGYQAREITEEEVSTESVVGHRFLEEGFEGWFEAFELAREGDWDEAWLSAVDGNRALTAVAIWSDSLRTDGSADICQA